MTAPDPCACLHNYAAFEFMGVSIVFGIQRQLRRPVICRVTVVASPMEAAMATPICWGLYWRFTRPGVLCPDGDL